MIVEVDKMRAYWLAQYDGLVGPAIGTGDKRTRLIIEAWVEAGRNVIVVWGPPGSGKSTNIAKFDSPTIMVVETTGLVPAMNKFFKRLPKDRISFVCHVAPRAICKRRVLARRNAPMGDNGPYLTKLIDKWFDTPKKKMLG